MIPFGKPPHTMFFDSDDTDRTEAIYQMLKAERRSRRFSLIIRLLLIGGLVYGYHFYGLPENAAKKEALINTAQTKFESFLTPVVERMTMSLTKKIQADMLGEQGTASPTRKANAKQAVANGVANPSSLSPEAIQMLCKNLPSK